MPHRTLSVKSLICLERLHVRSDSQGLVKCPDNKLTGMAFNFHS